MEYDTSAEAWRLYQRAVQEAEEAFAWELEAAETLEQREAARYRYQAEIALAKELLLEASEIVEGK
jgi:vacuolar-type H+-ATPase subunit E/Vma4